MVASAIAVAQLTKPTPKVSAGAVAIMLAPVSLGFAGIAIHSAWLTGRTWARRRRAADVGRALASLRDRYRVLSRLPVTRRRDDRVVVGPNGVFVVVTDEGQRITDGTSWRGVVDDCQIEALRVRARVRRALRRPFPVHAVLCVTDRTDHDVRQTHGVRVVDTARLATLIANTFTTAPLRAADIDAAVAALTATALESVPIPRRRRPRPRRQEMRSERRLVLV